MTRWPLRTIALALALFLLNVALNAPLFLPGESKYRDSIEGGYASMAVFISEHPNPFGWNPLQYGGMPTHFWYLPGIPYLSALAINLVPHLKPEHIYRLVTVTLACLPPPKEDFSNSAILLMEMYHSLSEQQGRTSKETILSNRDHAKTMHQETIKKLEEAAREMEKAAKSSTIAKIFGWIAMAFAAIVAVAAVIVSGGALGPLVGLAVTGVMIGLQASGAMGKITESLPSNRSRWKK